MAGRKKGHWLQKARARMKARGTEGAFGKATPKKIARAKSRGGLAKKRAVFAENMRKIAAKRKSQHHTRRTAKR